MTSKVDGNTNAGSKSHTKDEGELSIPELWKVLDEQIRVNIGTSVKCGICLCTVVNPSRTPCGHAFCHDCIVTSVVHSARKCPECQTSLSKRSLQPHRYLQRLATEYKQSLIEFGFTPSTYQPSFTTLTQKPLGGPACDSEDDDETADEDHWDRLQVAKTWQEKALPVAKPSAIQVKENEQVVQANLQACSHLPPPSPPPKKQPPKMNGVTGTQEAQEQAREQHVADMSLNQTRQEDTPDTSGRKNMSSSPFVPPPLSPIAMEGSQREIGTSDLSQENTSAGRRQQQAQAEKPPPRVPPKLPLARKQKENKHNAANEKAAAPLPQPENMKEKANVAGLVEDSFGALHWTNNESTKCSAPSQQEEEAFSQTLLDSPLLSKPRTRRRLQAIPQDADLLGSPLDAHTEHEDSKPHDMEDNDTVASLDSDCTEPIPTTANPKQTTSNRKLPAKCTRTTQEKPDSTANGRSPSSNKDTISSPKPTRQLRNRTEGALDVSTNASVCEESSNQPDSADNTPKSWPVGAVVHVQSRAWPGVNKQGGVARVTKVHDDSTFDVAYVLGGKETHVDGVFLSSNDQDAPPTRRSRRGKDNSELPASLLKELAAEGFDTVGKITLAQVKLHASKQQNRMPNGPSSSNQPSKSKRRRLQDTSNQCDSEQQTPKRTAGRTKKSTSLKKDEPTSKPARSKQAKRKIQEEAEEETAGAAKAPTKESKKVTKKARSSLASGSTGSRTSRRKVSVGLAPAMTNGEACNLADERYRSSFQEAVDSKVVSIATSNLSEHDMDALRAICGKPLPNGVVMKLSDGFSKKTTLCVSPLGPEGGKQAATILRTAKTMRASLAGIPIVSPSWIQACGEQGVAVAPTPELVARSLPTKTVAVESAGEYHFGVAKLAAYHAKAVPLPLTNHFIFFCGAFSEKKRKDLQLLCREAGAKVLSSVATLLTKLEASKATVALICYEARTGAVVPPGVAKQLESSSAESTLVVNPNWVFDSISCAKAMPSKLYPPMNTKAKQLWQSNQAMD